MSLEFGNTKEDLRVGRWSKLRRTMGRRYNNKRIKVFVTEKKGDLKKKRK